MEEVFESRAGEIILEAIDYRDAKRARSKQKEIGASQLGGCRTQVWLQIQGAPETNKTDRLAAIMGTAIHKTVEDALRSYSMGSYQLEVELPSDELPGHSDWVHLEDDEIVDVKTKALKNKKYFPDEGEIWQVQNYARTAIAMGHEIKYVTLVCIFRDGHSADVLSYTEPYSEESALEGLAWLKNVRERTEMPDPEKSSKYFCPRFCEYFGGACPGNPSAPFPRPFAYTGTLKVVRGSL